MVSRGTPHFVPGRMLAPLLFLIAGCSTMDGAATAACPESQAVQIENYPPSILLPQDAIVERQTAGHPPEHASDNHVIVAKAAGTVETVAAFYRCMLPRRNLSIISEEQGNVLLIRFAGANIDDGSITISGDRDNGGTRIEIFVIEKAQ